MDTEKLGTNSAKDDIDITLLMASSVDGSAALGITNYISYTNSNGEEKERTPYSQAVTEMFDSFDAFYTTAPALIDAGLREYTATGSRKDKVLIIEDPALVLDAYDIRKLMDEYAYIVILTWDRRHVAMQLLEEYHVMGTGEEPNLCALFQSGAISKQLFTDIAGRVKIHNIVVFGFSAGYTGTLLKSGVISHVAHAIYPAIIGCYFAEHPIVGIVTSPFGDTSKTIAVKYVGMKVYNDYAPVMFYDLVQKASEDNTAKVSASFVPPTVSKDQPAPPKSGWRAWEHPEEETQ